MFPRTVPSEISEEMPRNSPRKCFFGMSLESLILVVESVKATSGINSPVFGKVVEVNEVLFETPGLAKGKLEKLMVADNDSGESVASGVHTSSGMFLSKRQVRASVLASDKCQREKRKTINGDDLLWAMATLGFEEYIEPLKLYLTRYREGDSKGSARGGDANAKRDGQSSQNGQFSQLAHQGSYPQGPYGNSQVTFPLLLFRSAYDGSNAGH
ncbi:hypothetical protein F2Q70_00028494 [Brassica cretica]|uniref:Transcription factor CBF/NF-Y/archaeal histone domain-containing protein n=1 Tax=Brassica cretica TaxID=69181 RepID=A0A8S9LFH4_BRACR|nr:hypothetical protein F2Q70_00028494 [Brassica cretica]